MALAYARAVCAKATVAPLGDLARDAFAVYGVKPSLRATYNLLIGLGMRESSGEHCCGRDMSASFSSSESAEAGLFQASWGARRADPKQLEGLFRKYSADRSGCLLDAFKEGVACGSGDAKNWGTGDGAAWQKLTKECPAFAVDYTAVLLRVHGGTKGEFGPLRRKEAELRPECDAMLAGVERMVTEKPAVCP